MSSLSYFDRKNLLMAERLIMIFIFLNVFFHLHGQDSLYTNTTDSYNHGKEIYGFIRGGIYSDIDNENHDNPYVSSIFSDFDLKLGIGNGINYKAFTDVRFRYGTEFSEPVNRFSIREGYIELYGKHWDWSAGQKITKWGRADFVNPTSKLNPRNYVSRSPDREDMDLGNLLTSVKWFPTGSLSCEAVVIPLYRPSVLLIDPIPMPENVTLNQTASIVADKKMLSYGLKADFHLTGIDWSLSWFDGYDPMPGIALTSLSLDLTQPVPVPLAELTTTPYKIHMAGLDFELSTGDIGIRGEGSWTVPYLSHEIYEYVPFPEISWVSGIDWAKGILRFTAEYSGKCILDFTPSDVDPVFGSETDYLKLSELFQIPGFDLQDYFRRQVAAFNRLYNYQLEKYYHSAGLKIDADLIFGKLSPSLFTMYNFTSRDLLVIPEIKVRPADGLSITAGAEIYSGVKGSMYDIVNGYMNSIYLSLRVDF
jgi:hypothetical protein